MKRFFSRALYHLLGKRMVFCLPPYDYVQLVVERDLGNFLNCKQDEIRLVMIVGGYRGNEIHRMLRSYPNAQFHVFEPSKRYFASLQKTFAHTDRVKVVELAVSDSCGEVEFYETNLGGNGSLLKVGQLSRRDYGMEQAESFRVQTITLDSYLEKNGLADKPIDLLWCDVQGAEMKVLRGGPKALERVRTLFLEVAALEPTYEGGCMLADLNGLLRPAGFEIFGMGLDAKIGTGNAFYVNAERRSR